MNSNCAAAVHEIEDIESFQGISWRREFILKFSLQSNFLLGSGLIVPEAILVGRAARTYYLRKCNGLADASICRLPSLGLQMSPFWFRMISRKLLRTSLGYLALQGWKRSFHSLPRGYTTAVSRTTFMTAFFCVMCPNVKISGNMVGEISLETQFTQGISPLVRCIVN